MPKITFEPKTTTIEVDANTKLLLAGRRANVDIRFACASCRCGSCAVRIASGSEQLSPMKDDEKRMLTRLKLPLDGSIRLACQSRANGDCTVDLGFQNEYDSDIGLEDD